MRIGGGKEREQGKHTYEIARKGIQTCQHSTEINMLRINY